MREDPEKKRIPQRPKPYDGPDFFAPPIKFQESQEEQEDTDKGKQD